MTRQLPARRKKMTPQHGLLPCTVDLLRLSKANHKHPRIPTEDTLTTCPMRASLHPRARAPLVHPPPMLFDTPQRQRARCSCKHCRIFTRQLCTSIRIEPRTLEHTRQGENTTKRVVCWNAHCGTSATAVTLNHPQILNLTMTALVPGTKNESWYGCM